GIPSMLPARRSVGIDARAVLGARRRERRRRFRPDLEDPVQGLGQDRLASSGLHMVRRRSPGRRDEIQRQDYQKTDHKTSHVMLLRTPPNGAQKGPSAIVAPELER